MEVNREQWLSLLTRHGFDSPVALSPAGLEEQAVLLVRAPDPVSTPASGPDDGPWLILASPEDSLARSLAPVLGDRARLIPPPRDDEEIKGWVRNEIAALDSTPTAILYGWGLRAGRGETTAEGSAAMSTR